jgi:hypothetical protein
MARYKIPKHIFFTDSYPMTASGKVQKFKLREQAAALVGSLVGVQQVSSSGRDLHDRICFLIRSDRFATLTPPSYFFS